MEEEKLLNGVKHSFNLSWGWKVHIIRNTLQPMVGPKPCQNTFKDKQNHQQINIPNLFHKFQQHSGKFHNMSRKHIEPNTESSKNTSRECPSDEYPSKHKLFAIVKY